MRYSRFEGKTRRTPHICTNVIMYNSYQNQASTIPKQVFSCTYNFYQWTFAVNVMYSCIICDITIPGFRSDRFYLNPARSNLTQSC